MKTDFQENEMKEKLDVIFRKDYTLNDLFIKNNILVFMIPALFYFLTPIAEFLLFSAFVKEHPCANEFTYPAVVYAAVFFGLIFAIVAYSCFFYKNRSTLKQQQIFKKPEIYLFSAISVIAIATTIVNRDPEMGAEPFRGIYYVLAELLIYFGCSAFISEKKLKKILVYVFVSLSVLLSATQLLNDFDIIEIQIYRIYNSTASVFYAGNYYGYFLTLAIMLSVAMLCFETTRKEKIFFIASFIINSIVFAMVNCLGTFLACIAGFAFLFIGLSIRNKKIAIKPVILFASFMLICFLVGLKYQSFFSDVVYLFKDVKMIAEDSENAGSAGTGRWGIWMATLKLIGQKPLFGWGAFGVKYELFQMVGINAVHSEYLQYAADYGIPVALIYISGLVCIFIRAWKNRRTMDEMSIACLVASFAYIVSAMFGNNISYVGPFYYIFLGLAVNYEKSEKPTAV